MTFDQAHSAGKVALCHLPGGAQLRYDPADGTVLRLPYPGMPRQWREASAYTAPIPADGWMHYRGCDCPVCRSHAAEESEERASA